MTFCSGDVQREGLLVSVFLGVHAMRLILFCVVVVVMTIACAMKEPVVGSKMNQASVSARPQYPLEEAECLRLLRMEGRVALENDRNGDGIVDQRKLFLEDDVYSLRWETDSDFDGRFDVFHVQDWGPGGRGLRCVGQFVGESIVFDRVEIGPIIDY